MTQDYNVFISWSGERSLAVAKTLRLWLPMVIQSVKPWMSDTDIEKGTRGLNEVTKALTGIRVGITCLTTDNLTEPWLLFEAGALSKTITDDTRLCTYLLGGLRPADIKQPLGMFQHTVAEKEDTRKLVHTVNKAVSESPVSDERLDTIFDALWPKMAEALASMPPSQAPTARRDMRDMVEEILELVRAEANAKIPQWNSFLKFNTNTILGNAIAQDDTPVFYKLPHFGIADSTLSKLLGTVQVAPETKKDKEEEENK